MKTLFTVILLLVFAGVAGFVATFALNFAGLPGALLAGRPGERSVIRFRAGAVIAAIGQSYVYLAFVAFIVSWTLAAAARDDVIGFIVWPFAFVAVVWPVYSNLIRARVEARESEHANPQVEAIHLTFFAALVGFFLFVFVPVAMEALWGWVPFVAD